MPLAYVQPCSAVVGKLADTMNTMRIWNEDEVATVD